MLSTSYGFVYVILITARWRIRTMSYPILQMTKLRLREVTQGYTAYKGQNWNSHSNSRCYCSWEGVSWRNKIWRTLGDFLLTCKGLARTWPTRSSVSQLPPTFPTSSPLFLQVQLRHLLLFCFFWPPLISRQGEVPLPGCHTPHAYFYNET